MLILDKKKVNGALSRYEKTNAFRSDCYFEMGGWCDPDRGSMRYFIYFFVKEVQVRHPSPAFPNPSPAQLQAEGLKDQDGCCMNMENLEFF